MKKSEEIINCYDNRELSWLKFNQRVLEESCDEKVPLGERLSFSAIYQSNLDEFFMVRVGSLYDQSLLMHEERENKTNMTSITGWCKNRYGSAWYLLSDFRN